MAHCSSTVMAERVSWYCALLLALLLVFDCCESGEGDFVERERRNDADVIVSAGNIRRPCDEIYVVREGETLQTIAERCGDPYIVEENPHIHDPDDVFPGLVIKINPFREIYN